MLKRTFQLLLVASLATATLQAATDPFVGDWKLNPSKSKLVDSISSQNLKRLRKVQHFRYRRRFFHVPSAQSMG